MLLLYSHSESKCEVNWCVYLFSSLAAKNVKFTTENADIYCRAQKHCSCTVLEILGFLPHTCAALHLYGMMQYQMGRTYFKCLHFNTLVNVLR